ncbi:MAG: sigma-54-dependent Fis family transcriptional regulator [Alphaproteobacteria bacterium]|nr:sigma-54-dependent Fis family transcriptional regulator [Alphaproteobacteria bacterium]MCB9696629.1 sigma-54-dependent Fis family transcriptional regulator [Alphaproteobacteria bacterium]
MGAGDTTLGDLSHADRWLDGDDGDEQGVGLGLAIAWCLSEPGRMGEVALLPDRRALVLGRGEEATVRFARLGPGRRPPADPLQGRLLSRRQLEVRAEGERVQLRNVGSCALKVDGRTVSDATLSVGQAFELDRQLVLVVVRRGALPDPEEAHTFGRADAHGIVGESMAAWELRTRLRFLARRDDPVLVLGESGTGKELAARALHARSPRAGGPFVSRNAATLPEGLVDAELFGNVRNYPNPGMVERPGLVGAADGGTLFLDEIGEMGTAVQAHLLRVLDRGGEYQRLGEARTRRSDLRFVAATNRDPAELKHDLAARLTLRVEVPGLADRLEDVPLVAHHLLGKARADAELAERFFDGEHARISPELVLALLGHRWTHHVRELDKLLWRALETSPGRALVLSPELRELLSPRQGPAPVDPESLDADALRAALEAAGGNVTRAASDLGLSSRYAMYRLLRRAGVRSAD